MWFVWCSFLSHKICKLYIIFFSACTKMSNLRVTKGLEKLKLEKLNNAKELKEIKVELKELEIELIKRRFWKELEIRIEAEIERLKHMREMKEKKN